MADTVNLFGSQVKKGYVIAGGGVIVIAVGYGWYKNRQSAATNASTASTPSAPSTAAGYAGVGGDSYPPDGTEGDPGDPNSTDPASGQTYGDESQFASGYGSLGDTGYGGYSGSAYYPPGVTGGYTTYTTNGQWAQAAESYLTSTAGASEVTVAAALGKYITGQPVSADQMSIIEQAIAFTGQPPQQGTDGYPPSIRQQGTSTPPPAAGNSVKLPNVVGMKYGQAYNKLTAAGLKVSPAKANSSYAITAQQPPGDGRNVTKGGTIKLTVKP